MKYTALLLLIVILQGCSSNSTSDLAPESGESIMLKWNKAYADDTIEKSALALEWALSFAGAMLPNAPTGVEINTNTITIYTAELGLNSDALLHLKSLHNKIRLSEEYQINGTIDMGRYVTLLIGAPEHYYKITGVPQHLNSLISGYTISDTQGYVNHSGVSLVHRKISFSNPGNLSQMFLAAETDPVTGEIYEYETVEVIANGQLRFGIFDSEGNRKNSVDPSYSNAGKPAKCMWCHESNIQGLFSSQDDFPGYLTYPALQAKLLEFRQNLIAQRSALNTGVDFSQTQAHTLTELLYISFMEPSAERLSIEWGMAVGDVQALLSGLETHVYDEFPFLGVLYDRNDIESLAPFTGLQVSTSVREQSATEVNHIDE